MLNAVAVKGVANYLGRATKPYAFWNAASAASITSPLSNKTHGTITVTGAEDFATKAQWSTLADSTYYTYSDFSTTDLAALFQLGEGVMLWWASVNMDATATGQNHMLAIGAGAGPQIRFNISKATSWRPDVWLAFDGETSATQYGGATNEFANATDTNVALLLDNRSGVKQLYRYVNGANVAGVAFNANSGLTLSNAVTKRIRIGADALNTPGSTFFGAFRRMGLVNYGTTMPTRINDIIAELHAMNSALTPLLARSLV